MFVPTSPKIIAMSIIAYLCVVAPSAILAKKVSQGTTDMSKYHTDGSQTKSTKSTHSSTSSTSASPTFAVRHIKNRNRSPQKNMAPRKDTARAKEAAGKTVTKTVGWSQTPTPTVRRRQNDEPTPEPTGESSTLTTVYINGVDAFALLLPQNPGETISDAEQDSVAYCTDGSGCGNTFPDGFITGAAYSEAADESYVQITGCIDSSQFPFASDDGGGQFDNRFPNGAQCTFGGYGASFIELVEPSANRFCMRCCKNEDDQQNCNSHQDRDGCTSAIPGTYEFGEVDCS